MFSPRYKQREYNSCVPSALTLLLRFHLGSISHRIEHFLHPALHQKAGFELLALQKGILDPKQKQRVQRTIRAMNRVLDASLFIEIPPWELLPKYHSAYVAFVKSLPGIWKDDLRALPTQEKYIVVDPSDPLIQQAIRLGSLAMNPQHDVVSYPNGHAVFCLPEVFYDPNAHPCTYRTGRVLVSDPYTASTCRQFTNSSHRSPSHCCSS